jgi:hypothetical protein
VIRWCGTDWGGDQPDREDVVAIVDGEPIVRVDLEVVPDEDEDAWEP